MRIYPFFVSQRFTDARKLIGKMSYGAAAIYRPDDSGRCYFTHWYDRNAMKCETVLEIFPPTLNQMRLYALNWK